ncbi:GNAT family N-acetyltransferase [Paenibacillus sp.]|uniref:GNAT family N-acetyltransferase n=1 Tax=Paenibacillus sp. TaxID=58172 RepID=UPI0028B14426|nr:GNAT family N-acetyltransferase [Paenibacillus sp.]
MNQNDQIMTRLRKEPLKNVSLLKMITSFHEVMESHLVEHGDQWGVLMLLPVTAYAYDHRVYPQADYIVFMDYSNPELFPALLQLLPLEAKFVFKLQDVKYTKALSAHFSIEKVRGFFSYSTTEGQIFLKDEEVEINHLVDDRLIPLWAANHYTKDEIEDYFQSGAFSVSIFQGDNPVSTCLAFRNEETIWEIGAVHTLESSQRNGYAKKVVRTAIQETLALGYIPRYHVLETNQASIKLAESIGLVPCVHLEHWINYIQ